MCLTENSACGGAAGCETKFATFLLLTHKSWNSSLFLIFKEERVYFDLQFWGDGTTCHGREYMAACRQGSGAGEEADWSQYVHTMSWVLRSLRFVF